jgi:hypothetical protein
MAYANPARTNRILATLARVPVGVRYLLAGLTMGCTWAFLNTPLPQRAISMALLFLVGPPVLHGLRSYLTRGQDRSVHPRASLVRFFGAKAVLVIGALVGTSLLQPVSPHAPLLIGVALTATVGILGPRLHPRLLIHPSPATSPATAASV